MSRFENKKEIVGLVLFFVAAAIILKIGRAHV